MKNIKFGLSQFDNYSYPTTYFCALCSLLSVPCEKYLFHFTLQGQSSTLVIRHSFKIQHQWLLTCCLEKVHSHLLHNPTVVQPHPHGFHGKPTGNHKQARRLSFNSSCMIKTCCDTSRKIHLVHDPSLGQHALSSSSAPFLQLGAMVLENIFFPPTSKNKTPPLVLPCAQYSGLRYDHRVMKKQMLALEKPVWREKTRLTRIEVQAVATSNSGRASFSTPWSRRRQKQPLLAGCRAWKSPISSSQTSRFSSRGSNFLFHLPKGQGSKQTTSS